MSSMESSLLFRLRLLRHSLSSMVVKGVVFLLEVRELREREEEKPEAVATAVSPGLQVSLSDSRYARPGRE